MSFNIGLVAYKLAFQLSPIILTGGVANQIPGGMLPLIAVTESLNFVTGLLSGGDISLDNFFANFIPQSGATLIDNQIGNYPFANQAVAANAIIAQPKKISMLMICPARGTLGYAAKLATMMALKATLDQHNALGGTYTVATPSYFYTNCILTGMSDASIGDSKQYQNAWRMDFVQPLLTQQDAEQAYNSLLSKIANGTPIEAGGTGQIAWSGLEPTVGNPGSLASSTLVPSSTSSAGAGISPSVTI